MTTQSVDPRKICLAIPSKMAAPDILNTVGVNNLIGTGRLGNQPMYNFGGSNVAATRMAMAHQFLTKTTCDWLVLIDDDIGFHLEDWDLLWEDHNGELAVCAEYLQKIPGQLVPAKWGLGFARVHRSVFDRLTELNAPDGTPWVRQGYYAGQLMWDFFPQGINSAGEYRQEDHGFWTLVKLADIPTRYERRTRLAHSGRYTWIYDAAALDADDCGQ